MNRRIYYAFALILIIMTGCKNEKSSISEGIRVKTLIVSSMSNNNEYNYSGTIEENNCSELSFNVGGTIKHIHAVPGEYIKRGDLIATIDATTLRNTYDAAQSLLIQAEDAYNRMKLLHDNNSLPEIQWIEIQSKLRQAKASEQIAKKSLSDCNLYAPFSGVISEKRIEVGQNTLPGIPVVKIVKIDYVKVKVSVPENEISHIKKGQKINIRVGALGNKGFIGIIEEKGIVANPMSRSYDVKARIPNLRNELMPGMICEAQFTNGQINNKIIIPNSIIQIDEDNHSFVWLNDKNKATKRYVVLGKITNNGIIINDGLNIGDEIIIEGQQKVSENTKIEIVK